mgnify:CR=1 FL=1
MAINPSASQTLSLNMKLLSNHDLGGFGGIGEGFRAGLDIPLPNRIQFGRRLGT